MIQVNTFSWTFSQIKKRFYQFKLFQSYLWVIALIGFGLNLWSLIKIIQAPPSLIFYFLILLLIISSMNSTSQSISKMTGITWDLGAGIVLGATTVFGLEGAIFLNLIRTIVLWLLIPTNKKNWKKSFNQLAFNNGMQSIATALGGMTLLYLRSVLGDNLFLANTIPFIVAAIVDEGTNITLLSTVILLQHGWEFDLRSMLKSQNWAIQLGLTTLALCSILISWALINYNWMGITLFFVPSLISAFAFRLVVTSMKQHMDSLEDMVSVRTADLAALNRQKDAFLAVLTHDMLTPLSSIRLFTEIIQEDPESIKTDPQLTDTMVHSQKTLMNLVQNVLDIEKLESGKSLRSRKRQNNLSQVLQDVVTMVQISAKRKSIDLTYIQRDPLIWMHCDSQQLERVFLNLLSNAVKYTPQNGSISILTRVENDHACIKISDTGYGIPEKDLPFIFEPYNRSTAHVDKENGSGLGLAIAKALIEEHKGVISIDSEEDIGTTFTINLPLTH